MKRIRRFYRKIKEKWSDFNIQNQQHQLLFFGLIIVGTVVFVLLHSVSNAMFNDHDSDSSSEAIAYYSYLADESRCWKPALSTSNDKQSKHNKDNHQSQWKVPLLFVTCKSHERFVFNGSSPTTSLERLGTATGLRLSGGASLTAN